MLTSAPFVAIPLTIIPLDWNPVNRSTRMVEGILLIWMPPLMGSVKLNLDGCSLGNLGQLRIRGMLMDHHGTLLKVFFKTVGGV